jgi:tRNA(fMet)-specific endonuclease VapC
MIVLDTDHLTELQSPKSSRRARLVLRLSQQGARPIATTIVSIEEQLRGRLASINRRQAGSQQVVPYAELLELVTFCSNRLILAFDQAAAQRFHDLRAAKIRIGTMDLKIASIVLVRQATLLSANLSDFRQVPGLLVEDWLS